MSAKDPYRFRIGGKVHVLDRDKIEDLALAMTSGPEPGIANQILASLQGDPMVETAERQTVEADDLSPPSIAADTTDETTQ